MPDDRITTLPTAPEVLRRHLHANPDALRALRTLPVPPSSAHLLLGQKRVTDLLAAHRQALHLSPTRLATWKVRRARVATGLATAMATRPQRSPQQVLADLVTRAKLRPADPQRPGAASVVVRSSSSTATATGLFGTSPEIRALAGLGMDIRPLREDGTTPRRYVVKLPILARGLGGEIDNVAWALRQLPGVEQARPDRHDLRLYFQDGVSARVAPADTAWHVEMTRADRAHTLTPGSPHGKAQGEGSVIAHPDTGWAPHPQYNQKRIDVARSYNTATNRSGGTAARHATTATPGSSFTLTHGTATGCVMVGGTDEWPRETGLSAAERAMDRPPVATSGRITGIAPRATVLPIKFLTDSLVDVGDNGIGGVGVLRLGDGDFEEVVHRAVALGADVMSLSVGGFLSDQAKDTLTEAILESDLIVVAAAGQTYLDNVAARLDPNDSVVEPARFPDVIAVAGCSTDGDRWSESHRGPNVDITAPADAVWVADFAQNDSGRGQPVLRAASGTSFATAIVAGAAASWVAHWGGRAELKKVYPHTPLAWVFREVLQRSARQIPRKPWDEVHFGPGILDVETLLTTPLPAPKDVPRPPAAVSNLLEDLEVGLSAGGRLLEQIAQGPMRVAAAAVVLAGALAAAVDELGRQLALGYAALEAAAGEAAETLKQTVAAGEQLLRDTAAAAQDAADAAADAGEEVVDAVAAAAEDLAEAGGEFVEDVLSWFS